MLKYLRQPRVLSLLIVLVGWQVLAWVLHSRSLPPPTAVLVTLASSLLRANYLKHLGATLARMLASFSLAMLSALVLAY